MTALGLVLTAGPVAAETNPVVSEDDAGMIEESAQSSLEFDKTLETTEWVNPDTGNRGTITPTQTFETDDGRFCREYHQTVTIGGEEQEAYGTACRTEDGSWEIVRDEPNVRSDGPVVTADEPPAVVYRDRVVYVPHPRPAYYRYPLLYPFALSIGIAFHDGFFRYYGRNLYYGGYPRYGGYRYYGGYRHYGAHRYSSGYRYYDGHRRSHAHRGHGHRGNSQRANVRHGHDRSSRHGRGRSRH